MPTRGGPPLPLLFWVVLCDYAAQIPYYLVNYYLPHKTPPSASAVVLLGVTLAWFLIGYFGLRTHKRFGFWLLTSFLIVEGGFYLTTLLSGGLASQLTNTSAVVVLVFIVGYITGFVSLTYAALLLVSRGRSKRNKSRKT